MLKQIARIKFYFAMKRLKKRAKMHRAGFEYALTQLRNNISPLELDSQQIDNDDFDRGMNTAINSYIRVIGIEDNRI